LSAETPAGPGSRYSDLLAAGQLIPDPEQRAIVDRMQALFERIDRRPTGWIDRLRKRHPPVRGLYLHGGVGRGKTLLMDLLAQSLSDPRSKGWRIHFHRFMAFVHDGLRHHHGEDPLSPIARRIGGRARVLCFDEFHVSDIADAMILGGLLQRLFARGVTLVATSNTAPDDLYADGLQRERFLPAIEAIKQHCDVVRFGDGEDFRLRELSRHRVYRHPVNTENRSELEAEFRALAAGEDRSSEPLNVRQRRIRPLYRAGSVVWFDFDTLCRGPRASEDYIELARRFGTLIVSDVPQLDASDDNAARRFIHLVDECYDRAVKLIVLAAAPPQSLYCGTRLSASFERTTSRLIEMQSHDYLARPHRP